MSMKINIFQALAWLGTLLIVTAYGLVSFEIILPTNVEYPVMNLVGAVFLGINLFLKKAPAALTLQIIWTIIALATLVKIFLS